MSINNPSPLLIAKQKDARFLKDDYKLGWLFRDETGYLWVVWGSSNCIENALKIAKQVVSEKANSTKVYLSEIPLERDKAIYEEMPKLKEINFDEVNSNL